MIAGLLSLVGLGGAGIALALFPGLAVRALEILRSAVGLIADYPWQAATALLIALSAWLWHGRGDARQERDVARMALKQLAQSYVREQAAARTAQTRMDREALAADIDHALKLEQAHAENVDRTRTAVAVYAAAHPAAGACRVLGQGDAAGAQRATVGSALRSDPGQPAGPQPEPAADLVAIPRIELEWFAWEAMQNAERGQYLDGRIASGRAVRAGDLPSPDFGPAP